MNYSIKILFGSPPSFGKIDNYFIEINKKITILVSVARDKYSRSSLLRARSQSCDRRSSSSFRSSSYRCYNNRNTNFTANRKCSCSCDDYYNRCNCNCDGGCDYSRNDSRNRSYNYSRNRSRDYNCDYLNNRGGQSRDCIFSNCSRDYSCDKGNYVYYVKEDSDTDYIGFAGYNSNDLVYYVYNSELICSQCLKEFDFIKFKRRYVKGCNFKLKYQKDAILIISIKDARFRVYNYCKIQFNSYNKIFIYFLEYQKR